MGQRHQLFLVARVRAAPNESEKYRCVAAFHHQWCYGTLPLLCVNRLKHLARTKANAALIRRDLHRYHEGVQRSAQIPCPYITFLAGTAFSVDIGGEGSFKYFSTVSYEDATMGSTDGDNNDGITVVDITNPEDFASIGGLEVEEPEEIPDLVPLTATQSSCCHPRISLSLTLEFKGKSQEEGEERHRKAIRDLDDVRLLTLGVLAATWPHEYGSGVDGDECSTAPKVVAKYCDEARPGSTSHVEPTSVESIAALNAAPDAVVGLSKRSLSSAELFATLKGAGPFRRLDVSHNPAIYKATFSQILAKHHLEWVNIEGCNVSDQDIIDLLKSQPPLFRGIEVIIHPAFLSVDCLEGDSTEIPSAFRVLYNTSAYFQVSQFECGLPFFGVDQIVQNLLDMANAHSEATFGTGAPTFHTIQSLFAASYRNGQPWAKRDIQTIPLQTTSKGFADGYTFVFIVEERPSSTPSPLYHYGIIPPGGEHKFLDVAMFLEHLGKEGWPKPKYGAAVKQVIKAYSEGGALLVDFDLTMKKLGFDKD